MNTDSQITDFLGLYDKLDKSNLQLLADVYHHDVVFEDPLHKVTGREALTQYFANLYENLQTGTFEIGTCFEEENKASVYWVMRFSHKKINRGESVTVHGNTYLEFSDGKVIFHRDFFDAGEMIYQYLPLFGMLVKLIKRRSAV